jgi:hypothetical protein
VGVWPGSTRQHKIQRDRMMTCDENRALATPIRRRWSLAAPRRLPSAPPRFPNRRALGCWPLVCWPGGGDNSRLCYH